MNRIVAALALLFSGVSAFAPTPTITRGTVQVKASTEGMPGIVAPTGLFDPVGLAAKATDARLKYFRESELKHGRVAMLASLGFVVGEKFHPLFNGAIDEPSYIAFQATPLQKLWPFVLTAIGTVEYISIDKFNAPAEGFWTLKAEYENGDLGFDPLGLKPTDPEKLKTMQTKEIQNGRLAMLGIAGMVAQELVTGGKL
uniref:Plastid light harvesting protein n=1 Tax=Aureoumbra lagunensis TaxID=44058 RepID=A0A6S7ZSZ0_9STRA